MRLALLITAILFSCTTLYAAPQKKRKAPALVKASVLTAVPGIDSLFVLNKEQGAKLRGHRKAILQTEDVKAARKTARDKSADRKTKRTARKLVTQAQSVYDKKAIAVLSEDQQKLISKIYASADAAQKKTQEEFAPRLKAARGDGETQRKIRKEMTAARKAQSHKAVLALLSDEQRKTVAAAAKNAPKKRQGKRDKNDGDDKDGKGGNV